MHPLFSKFVLTTAALIALAVPAAAGPEGATVVSGAATIQGQGTRRTRRALVQAEQ
jgi:hypothetical protein